jgi:putative ABC transport system ATP-binding protein
LLTLVGLSHRFAHRPHQLSGGEQQRVAIARALATNPSVVIADEPTGNLDASNGERLLQLIAELQTTTGTTFLVATHDATVASHTNRIIHLANGMLRSVETLEKAERSHPR